MFGLSMLKGGSGGVEPLVGNIALFLGGTNSSWWFSDYFTITSLSDATAFGSLSKNQNILPYATNDSGTGNRLVSTGSGIGPYGLEYNQVNTPGNGMNFGDLTDITFYSQGSCSNKTNNRGLIAGGTWNSSGNYFRTDYITINTLGNSTFFANLNVQRYSGSRNISNGTSNRGLIGGGRSSAVTAPINVIDYFTINSIADASDFGDLVQQTISSCGTSNGTNNRGIIAGNLGFDVDLIQYMTINSLGNASSFGNVSSAVAGTFSDGAGASNGTGERGLLGGYWDGSATQVDYITINSTGNSQNFGALTAGKSGYGAGSNS